MPDAPNSHDAYNNYLHTAYGQLRGSLITGYDMWLREQPSNVAAALERCRFILLSGSESSGEALEEEDQGDPAEDCVAELAERFPLAPAALQFRLEHLWGDEARAFGVSTLARTDIIWGDRDHALFAKHLAYVLLWQPDKLADAASYARLARDFDASADVGLILATEYKTNGLREQAIKELTTGSDPSYAVRKVALLVELEAFAEAQRLMESDPKLRASVAPLVQARILEGLGRTDAARAKYADVASQHWNRSQVLRRLFYLDLAGQDRGKASAAYKALRDDGYWADPLLRHRLALALAFPLAPWSASDLLGLLGLIALGLFIAVLPALVILPVHYVGLLRGEKAVPSTPAGERWSLKQLWLIASSVLGASILSAYLFAYDELHASLLGEPGGSSTRLQIARAGVLGILGAAAIVLGVLSRADFSNWLRGAWSLRRSFGAALLGVLAIYFVAGLNVIFIRVFAGDQATDSPLGMGLTTLELMRAVRDIYGPFPLFLLVAGVVPVYEEVAFRGVFLASVGRHLPFAWANTLQAACFTLAHDQARHYPLLFVLALVAGLLFKRSGGLAAPIMMHGVVNALAVLALSAAPSMSQIKARRADKATMPLLPTPEQAQQRCAQGEGAACFRLAYGHYYGKSVPQDYVTSSRLFAKACDAGIAPGCDYLGLQHSLGQGVEKDPVQSFELFRAGCQGGDANACTNLGLALEGNLKADPLVTITQFEKGCEGGSAKACNRLGRHYSAGLGVARDLVRSAKFFERACAGGNSEGCANEATAYRRGWGVTKDLARAARTFERACDAGEASACGDLGSMLLDGEGQTKDGPRAVKLLQRGCEARRRSACTALGTVYLAGALVPKDAALAARWFAEACAQNDALGCFQIAALHEQGEGVPVDAAQAAAFMRKACAAGFQGPACE